MVGAFRSPRRATTRGVAIRTRRGPPANPLPKDLPPLGQAKFRGPTRAQICPAARSDAPPVHGWHLEGPSPSGSPRGHDPDAPRAPQNDLHRAGRQAGRQAGGSNPCDWWTARSGCLLGFSAARLLVCLVFAWVCARKWVGAPPSWMKPRVWQSHHPPSRWSSGKAIWLTTYGTQARDRSWAWWDFFFFFFPRRRRHLSL